MSYLLDGEKANKAGFIKLASVISHLDFLIYLRVMHVYTQSGLSKARSLHLHTMRGVLCFLFVLSTA